MATPPAAHPLGSDSEPRSASRLSLERKKTSGGSMFKRGSSLRSQREDTSELLGVIDEKDETIRQLKEENARLREQILSLRLQLQPARRPLQSSSAALLPLAVPLSASAASSLPPLERVPYVSSGLLASDSAPHSLAVPDSPRLLISPSASLGELPAQPSRTESEANSVFGGSFSSRNAQPPPDGSLKPPGMFAVTKLQRLRKNFGSISELEENDAFRLASHAKALQQKRRSNKLGKDLKTLLQPVVEAADGFIVETPSESADPSVPMSVARIDAVRWFQKYFYPRGSDVLNIVGVGSGDHGPIIISIIKEQTDDSYYRIILRTRLGQQKLMLPASAIEVNDRCSAQRLVMEIAPQLIDGNFRLAEAPALNDALLEYEKVEVPYHFKFGVICALPGQKSDIEALCNTTESRDFTFFLSLLGQRVPLKGWSRFAAGLDVSHDRTGTHGLFYEQAGREIMFHVSTLLPHSPTDPQQLERKRFIGNDLVLVIFMDGSTSWNPKWVTSKMTCVQIVVQVQQHSPSGNPCLFRVGVACKVGVPAFSPALSKEFDFTCEELQRWLLTKLINAEIATLRSPTFAERMVASRNHDLDELLHKFSGL